MGRKRYKEYRKGWSKEKRELEIIGICLQLDTSMLGRNMVSAEKRTGDTLKWSTQASVPIYAGRDPGCTRTIQGLICDF